MNNIRKILLLISTTFLLTGCIEKYDITKKSYMPEQAIGLNDRDYKTTEEILRSSPHWSKNLENKTLRFNMFVEDTFNEIENKKEYLRRTYNVQYYNFDEKGFNVGNNTEVKLNPKNEVANKNIKEVGEKKLIESNTQEIKIGEDKAIQNKKIQNTLNNKNYENQIYNEYNF